MDTIFRIYPESSHFSLLPLPPFWLKPPLSFVWIIAVAEPRISFFLSFFMALAVWGFLFLFSFLNNETMITHLQETWTLCFHSCPLYSQNSVARLILLKSQIMSVFCEKYFNVFLSCLRGPLWPSLLSSLGLISHCSPLLGLLQTLWPLKYSSTMPSTVSPHDLCDLGPSLPGMLRHP